MPRHGTGAIEIEFPETFSVWINQKDYTDYVLNYEFKEQLNNVGEFYVDLFGISSAERNDVAVGKDVQLRFANNLIFKGTIERPNYKSYEFCTIKGFGTVETYLKNQTVEWRRGKCYCDSDSTEGRPVYTHGSVNPKPATVSGASTQDIVVGQLSGVSNVAVGTNDYLGHLVARSDHDNILSFLDGVVRNMSGVWWSSYGSYPYNNNYFNVSTSRTDGTIKKIFNVSGDNQNADETGREVDEEALLNSVNCLGYGDGKNQLRSKVYHATDDFTRLASGCSASGLSITVEDASVLPASGTLWVGMEQLTLTSKSGNNLTVVRSEADGTDSNGQGYLKKYAHSKGVAVYNAAYTENSTDGNSRIDTYGLKQQTYVDKRILDQDALDQAATNILIDNYDLKERIRLVPSDMRDCLKDIVVGDTVTVNDSESGLSGNYVVVGQTLKNNEGYETLEYELSNTLSTFTEDVRQSAEKIKVGSQYMQGSTTSFNVQSYENCDASNPLHVRVYLPSDIIAVNKALLDFKIQDYRAYTSTTPSGGGDTSGSSSTNTTSNDTGFSYDWHSITVDTVSVDTNWTDVTTAWTQNVDGSATFVYIGILSEGNVHFRIKATKTGETALYFPGGANGVNINLGSAGGTAHICNFFFPCLANLNGWTIQPQFKMGSGSKSLTVEAYYVVQNLHSHGMEHTHTTPNHTHAMTYAIDTTASGSDAQVDIDIGPDGGTLGRVANNQTGTVSKDISKWIVSGINLEDGNWMDIKLTPNKACRIEANVFLKCFIQAR